MEIWWLVLTTEGRETKEEDIGREKWRQAVSVLWHISRRLHLPLPYVFLPVSLPSLRSVTPFFARARVWEQRKEDSPPVTNHILIGVTWR